MPNIYTKCATNEGSKIFLFMFSYLYMLFFVDACVYCPYMFVSIFIHVRSTVYIQYIQFIYGLLNADDSFRILC